MSFDDCLAALELDRSAGPAEVKQAYRDLVRIWHPDRFTHDARLSARAQEKTKRINEAYRLLSRYFEGDDVFEDDPYGDEAEASEPAPESPTEPEPTSADADSHTTQNAPPDQPMRDRWPERWAIGGGLVLVVLLVGFVSTKQFSDRGGASTASNNRNDISTLTAPRTSAPQQQQLPSQTQVTNTNAALALIPTGEPTAREWYELGYKLLREKKAADAAPLLRQATVVDPGFFEAHYELGWAEYTLGHFPEAIKSFQRANSLHPNDERPLIYAGMALWEIGSYASAKVRFKDAVFAAPDNLEANVALAVCYCLLGETANARAQAAVVARIDPAAATGIDECIADRQAELNTGQQSGKLPKAPDPPEDPLGRNPPRADAIEVFPDTRAIRPIKPLPRK